MSVLFVGGFGATLDDNYRAVPRLFERFDFYRLEGGVSPRRHARRLEAWLLKRLPNARVVVAHSLGTVALLVACDSPRLRSALSAVPVVLSNAPLSLASLLAPLPRPLATLVELLLTRTDLPKMLRAPPVSLVVPCSWVVRDGSDKGCDAAQGLAYALEFARRANDKGVCDWYPELQVYGLGSRDDVTVYMSDKLWKSMRHVRKPLVWLERGGHEPFHGARSGRAWADVVLKF